MSIVWSPQQETALKLVRAWFKDPDAPQIFYLAGYAGTGKTTLALELTNNVGGEVLFCAFTGKAASVMRKSGCANAKTIHQLIYTATKMSDKHLEALKEELRNSKKVSNPPQGLLMRMRIIERSIKEQEQALKRPHFVIKEVSEVQHASLVVVDECSVVNERMAEDLASFGVRILVLGDPAQLPPVRGGGAFTNREPDMTLTEIHRQAADSPIIRLATQVRRGEGISLGDYGLAKVVEKVTPEEVQEFSQILCGRNTKRQGINKRMRQLAGIEAKFPTKGEKLVCLRNNHDLGLLNGTLWNVTDNYDDMSLAIENEDGLDMRVAIEEAAFIDDMNIPHFPHGEVFTWGYALTVHKSQGSQWPSVLLFNDWTHKGSMRRWLYTGITRAQEKLTVVM